MTDIRKHLFAALACVLAVVMTLALFTGCGPANNGENTAEPDVTEEPEPTEEPAKQVPVLAHWKLQNEDGCFTGSVDDDSVGFKDLTGNGNDLIAKVTGNGAQLDIFEWDTVDSGTVNFKSALKMNNTKALAATVDPYNASETSYTGGYTSGKYLETVMGAPLNAHEFKNGFTFEIIFKLSPELDNNYNRYTGIFSRQGVIEDRNEPPFSIAITEWKNDASGTIGKNETWMQLILMTDDISLNNEDDSILIGADTWHHLMLTYDPDMNQLRFLIDGAELFSRTIVIDELPPTGFDLSWEVGVGRKSANSGDAKSHSMNENSPAGMIRRLFAGSVAEIRVMDGAIGIEESLYASQFVNE